MIREEIWTLARSLAIDAEMTLLLTGRRRDSSATRTQDAVQSVVTGGCYRNGTSDRGCHKKWTTLCAHH